jgi:membrane-associated protein
MHHFALIPFVQHIGYAGIFAVIFAESGLFFSFFLPGASLLFASGILASQGFFNITALIGTVVLAAVVGDSVGYWFGAWVGPRLYAWKDSRWFHTSSLDRAHALYEKHGGVAIVLARFVPIVRTFAPIVAGIVQMPYVVFLGFNILGSLIWGAGIVCIGYFFGTRIPFVSNHLELILLLVVLITVLPLVREWLPRKRARHTPSHTT